MNDNKRKIILMLIAIAILLVTMVGATFSYFAYTYQQVGNNKTIDISTEKVTEITYYPGASITFNNLDLPMSTKGTYIKISEGTFRINGTGSNVEDTISYDIGIVVNTNTLKTATGQGVNGIVMCKLYSSNSENGQYTRVGGDINCDNSRTLVSNEEFNTILDNDIATGNKYYRLEIYVWNHDTVDNSLTGKAYNATIKLDNVQSEQFPIVNNN